MFRYTYRWIIFIGLLAGAVNASDLAVAKELHEKLWEEVYQKYDCQTRTQVNSKEEVLVSIKLPVAATELQEKTELHVPAAIAAQFDSFSFLEIEGEGLLGVDLVERETPGAHIILVLQIQNDNKIRIASDEIKGWNLDQEKFVFKGAGRIDKITLVSLEGIPAVFNNRQMELPGMRQPRLDCGVKVDSRIAVSIDGVGVVDGEKFHRLYVQPGRMGSSLKQLAEAKGFKAGRQMVKLGPELETQHESFKPPLMKEDASRPGYADLSIFNQRTFEDYAHTPRDFKFAFSLDCWPSFMEASIPGQENLRGTPDFKHFDAAAELAAAYISAEVRDGGRTANFWEVKNESDVIYEWVYHASGKHDSWDLLSDFHNQVAQKIKAAHPEVMVGGPASAWPRMEMGRRPFELWTEHQSFMQKTREDLDFYSHHFYDKGTIYTYEARYQGYEDWLQGRLTCVLDLLRAEMIKTENVKPLLITEYGALTGGVRDVDYWLRVSNMSSFLIEFMSRPAEIELAVPFLLGKMHWEPNSGHALVRKDINGNNYLTKARHFLDLWAGFEGTIHAVEVNGPDKVKALVCSKGNKLYLAVNNRSNYNLRLNPDIILPDGTAMTGMKYRAATYTDGKFSFIENEVQSGDRVNLAIGETVIFEAQTDQAIVPTSLRKKSHHFAEIDAPFYKFERPELKIDLNSLLGSGKITDAKLVVGVYQEAGDNTIVNGYINGHPFESSPVPATGITHFFEPVTIPIPLEHLKIENEIDLGHDLPMGSMITTVKLVIEQGD